MSAWEAFYLCENGHVSPLGTGPSPACLECGSTSEAHLVSNGGLGRIFYMFDGPLDVYFQIENTGRKHSDWCRIRNQRQDHMPIIDSIALMKEVPGKRDWARVAKVAEDLKAYAKKVGVPVITDSKGRVFEWPKKRVPPPDESSES